MAFFTKKTKVIIPHFSPNIDYDTDPFSKFDYLFSNDKKEKIKKNDWEIDPAKLPSMLDGGGMLMFKGVTRPRGLRQNETIITTISGRVDEAYGTQEGDMIVNVETGEYEIIIQ